jgi:hypothetical protein
MKKQTWKKTMALGLLAVGTVGVIAAGAAALDEDGRAPPLSDDAKLALENNDYDAFIDAMVGIDPDVEEKVTLERFQKMISRHQTRMAIDEAVNSGDYNAWLEAVADLPHGQDMAQIVTADEFDLLIQMHEARQSGDHETAKEIREEIGLPEPRHHRGQDGGCDKDGDNRRGPPGQNQGEYGSEDGEQKRGPLGRYGGEQGNFNEGQENQRRGPPRGFRGRFN